MLAPFTFWLIVLAVLIAYLCLSVRLRLRAEEARRGAYEKEHPGRAFDASTIAPQIAERMTDLECPIGSTSAGDSVFVVRNLVFLRHEESFIRHSYPSASIGSTFAARRAGNQQASIATASNKNATQANVSPCQWNPSKIDEITSATMGTMTPT